MGRGRRQDFGGAGPELMIWGTGGEVIPGGSEE